MSFLFENLNIFHVIIVLFWTLRFCTRYVRNFYNNPVLVEICENHIGCHLLTALGQYNPTLKLARNLSDIQDIILSSTGTITLQDLLQFSRHY